MIMVIIILYKIVRSIQCFVALSNVLPFIIILLFLLLKDHLVCYLPGTLVMGHFMGEMPKWHLELAEGLLQTCMKMYTDTQTGLSPEIAHFNLARNGDHDIIIKVSI